MALQASLTGPVRSANSVVAAKELGEHLGCVLRMEVDSVVRRTGATKGLKGGQCTVRLTVAGVGAKVWDARRVRRVKQITALVMEEDGGVPTRLVTRRRVGALVSAFAMVEGSDALRKDAPRVQKVTQVSAFLMGEDGDAISSDVPKVLKDPPCSAKLTGEANGA